MCTRLEVLQQQRLTEPIFLPIARLGIQTSTLLVDCNTSATVQQEVEALLCKDMKNV